MWPPWDTVKKLEQPHMSICIYPHFHKPFPYNEKSDWIKPCHVDKVDIGKNSIFIDWIYDDFYKYYEAEGVSKDDFLKAFGQQATEYWLLKEQPEVDNIGCNTYRRMLSFKQDVPVYNGNLYKIFPYFNDFNLPADRALDLGTEDERRTILHFMSCVDVITNKSTYLNCSVSEQYLQSQPVEYWDLFHKAILELNYDQESLLWFEQNRVPFTTTYIFKKEYFLKYSSELFQILEYIYKNCSKVYPTKQSGDTFSEPFPWRYPGFIGERFLGFFIHANSLSKMEVPLIFLE